MSTLDPHCERASHFVPCKKRLLSDIAFKVLLPMQVNMFLFDGEIYKYKHIPFL